MQIDPLHVTASDIRRYEKLMSGKAVRALSNAHSMTSIDSGDASSKQMFTKHHWIVNENGKSTPIELEFERPTSLISLNIELTFNCKDSTKLLEKLNVQQILKPKAIDEESSLMLPGDEVAEADNKIDTSSKTVDTLNLGLLSIHGQGADGLSLTHQST